MNKIEFVSYKGWEKSKGAKLELLTALEHGLEIIVEK